MYEAILNNSMALLFIIIGLGYLLGKLKIRSFQLGPVAGVLLVGLLFGNYGYEISPEVQTLGFTLFIFSIGFEAGPLFFSVLRADGIKYLTLAIVIAALGFTLAVLLSDLFGFPFGSNAGVLAGGLTSSPTLAAAQQAIMGGTVPLPEGYTVDEAVSNITTCYAVTYIFGLIGLILLIKYIPKLAHVNLPEEAAKLEAGKDKKVPIAHKIVKRAYRITEKAAIGIPVKMLYKKFPGKATIEKFKRDGKYIEVTPETTLAIGDEITFIGQLELFKDTRLNLGPELTEDEMLAEPFESVRIVAVRSKLKKKRLIPTDITTQYGCILTRLQRVRVDVAIGSDVEIEPGDVLHVTGSRSLLIIGYLRSIHPTFGRVPGATRWVFMELGLLMFMTGVGLTAGQDIVETFLASGASLIVSGIIITTVPVLIGYLFGRRILKLNPTMLLGAITGAMTSGAALSIIKEEAKSSIPSLGYTGTYVFANVILTIAGTVILFI
jgi:putative transport protein